VSRKDDKFPFMVRQAHHEGDGSFPPFGLSLSKAERIMQHSSDSGRYVLESLTCGTYVAGHVQAPKAKPTAMAMPVRPCTLDVLTMT
jgi:hypothetical protein